jgi:hypothetical protein
MKDYVEVTPPVLRSGRRVRLKVGAPCAMFETLARDSRKFFLALDIIHATISSFKPSQGFRAQRVQSWQNTPCRYGAPCPPVANP